VGIVKYKPDSEIPIHSPLDSIKPSNYLTAIEDDSHVPVNSLLGYIQGAPWTIDYYSQILGRDSDLKDLDTQQLPLYQPYKKIVGLEFRVETPINQGQQEEESAVMSVTGTALVYPVIIPNVGDLFVGAAGNLHKAIYRISAVERKSFNRSAVYYVSFDLQVFINNDPENRYTDLVSKVIRTYYYYKDRMVAGLNPLIMEHENAAYRDFKGLYLDICRYYFSNFLSREHMTLIIPGQSQVLYDPYVVTYLSKITEINDAPEIAGIRNLGTELDDYMKQPNIWTALLERQVRVLDYCHLKMGTVSVLSFSIQSMLKGLRFSNVDAVIYPIVPDTSMNSLDHTAPKIPMDLVFTETPPHRISDGSILKEDYVDVDETIPYIHPVSADDYYVFRESFYKQTDDVSLLESLTLNYLKKESMDVNRLHALAIRCKGFGRLEQFYYIPIILTLLKAAIYESY